MSRLLAPRRADSVRKSAGLYLAAALLVSGCATTSPYHLGENAERAQDYDRAVVEYTKAVHANPEDRTAKLALDRARLRSSQEHFFRGRRFAASQRYEDALMEFQVASELNPGSADIDAALRDARLRFVAAASPERVRLGTVASSQPFDRSAAMLMMLATIARAEGSDAARR